MAGSIAGPHRPLEQRGGCAAPWVRSYKKIDFMVRFVDIYAHTSEGSSMSKSLQDIGLTEPDEDVGFDASKYDHWSQDLNRKPWLINKSQMAEFCGVSLKTIDDWIRRGAPVYAYGDHGVSYQLDVTAFIEWTISYRSGADVETLRTRDIEERRKFREQDRQRELESENQRLRLELAALKRKVEIRKAGQ
jgi:hypothetical protein